MMEFQEGEDWREAPELVEVLAWRGAAWGIGCWVGPAHCILAYHKIFPLYHSSAATCQSLQMSVRPMEHLKLVSQNSLFSLQALFGSDYKLTNALADSHC